jgi:hypothetical protein
VLSNGSSKGFIGSIPIGGHWAPNSTVGVRALWKKAQKIAIKNNASDTIKSIIPKLSPFWTANVWSPKNVLSLIISLNHKDIEITTNIIDIYNNIYVLWKLCRLNAVLVVRLNKAILVYKGQGEGDTKWKGWSWKLLLISWEIEFTKKHVYQGVSIYIYIENIKLYILYVVIMLLSYNY